MPVSYPTPEWKGSPQATTLTVREFIELLAKQPLDAPVGLTYEGVETSVWPGNVAIKHGCVVIDAERGERFLVAEWEAAHG